MYSDAAAGPIRASLRRSRVAPSDQSRFRGGVTRCVLVCLQAAVFSNDAYVWGFPHEMGVNDLFNPDIFKENVLFLNFEANFIVKY